MELKQIQSLPKGLAQNCWILINGEEAVVIDPGCKTPEPILEILKNRAKIVAILLTHNHFDHVRTIKELYKKTNAPIFIHKNDAEVIEKGWIALEKIQKPKNAVGVSTQKIEDGEILDFGGMKIEVIATPGHTHGSCCFLVGDKLFSGDTLFRENVGRTDLAGGEEKDLKTSLAKLLELPNETKIYPGHDKNWTIKKARNFFV